MPKMKMIFLTVNWLLKINVNYVQGRNLQDSILHLNLTCSHDSTVFNCMHGLLSIKHKLRYGIPYVNIF